MVIFGKKPISIFTLTTAMQIAGGMSLIVWLAYFSLCSSLGLYQDDVFMYHILQKADNGILSEAFDFVKDYGGQGRPVTQVIMVLFAWVGSQIGGVSGLYVVGWILLSVLATLMFLCLRNFFSRVISLFGATFYILFPANTAKFFAISFPEHICAILFLFAALLLIRGRYFLAALSLLLTVGIYEQYILLGFLLPLLLLACKGDHFYSSVRKSFRFLLSYGFLLVVAITYRLLYAPGRASDALLHKDKFALVNKIFESIYYGMSASASSVYDRISEFLTSGESQEWTVMVLTLAVLLFLLSKLTGQNSAQVQSEKAELPRVISGYIFIFGLMAWAATYPLYGLYPARFPPSIIDGKMSNVHGPAAIGLTMLFAVALHTIEIRCKTWSRLLVASRLLVVLYLAILAGFFVGVQQRYVDSWHYQLSFWRQLPEVVPNLSPKSLVVVEEVGLDNPRLEGGSPFDWTLPYLFPFMWQMPPDWTTVPLVIPKWAFDLYSHVYEGHVEIVGYPTMASRSFSTSEVIMLRVREGQLFAVIENSKPSAGRIFQLYSKSIRGSHRFARGELQLRAANLSPITVTPNNFSGGGWVRGIMNSQHENSDMFYFIVTDKENIPIRVGSVLKFSTAGKARVKKVDVTQQGEVFAVFVTVDRGLSPARDGYPNQIRVLHGH